MILQASPPSPGDTSSSPGLSFSADWKALALSLLTHLLFLSAALFFVPKAEPIDLSELPAIDVDLVIAAQPPPPQPPTAPEEAKPKPKPKPKPKAKPKAKPPPPPLADNTSEPPAPVAEQPSASRDQDLPPPPAPAAETGLPGAVFFVPAPAPSPDILRQSYAEALWRHILKFKPLNLHDQGTVSVAFTVDAQGLLVSCDISSSSGNRRLDRAALETIGRAQPFPARPPGLGTAPLSFSLPFQFRTRSP